MEAAVSRWDSRYERIHVAADAVRHIQVNRQNIMSILAKIEWWWKAMLMIDLMFLVILLILILAATTKSSHNTDVIVNLLSKQRNTTNSTMGFIPFNE